MNKVLITESYLENIADAIRAKNGSQDEYTPGEMSEAIDNIPSPDSYLNIHPESIPVYTSKPSASWLTNNLFKSGVVIPFYVPHYDTSGRPLTSLSYLLYNYPSSNPDIKVYCDDNITSMSRFCGGDIYNAYAGTNKSTLDVSGLNSSNVTDMSLMFANCQYLHTIYGLETLNTSKVTNFTYMFATRSTYYGGLLSLDLSHFNTSNVTTLYGFCSGQSKLTSIDVSNWNTSKVTTMYATFSGCSSLETLDLSDWDFGKVNGFKSGASEWGVNQMFYGCSSLKNLTFGINLGRSFAYNANRSYAGHNLDFTGCPLLTRESALDVINKVADITDKVDYQGNQVPAYIKFHADTRALLTTEEVAIAINKGWTVS